MSELQWEDPDKRLVNYSVGMATDIASVIDSMKLSTEDVLTGEKNTHPLPEFIKNKMRAAVGLGEVDDGE